MTTIAYDGKVLAVDSQVTSGTMRFGTVDKFARLNDGRMIAFAGHPGLLPEIVAWLNGGEKPVPADGDCCNSIVVSLDGSAIELDGKLHMFPASIPWSGGSGESIAMTAMLCGKSADKAVELACRLDIYSGLPVRTYTP